VIALLAAFVPVASAQVFPEEDTELRRQRREAHSPRLENALLQAREMQGTNPDHALDILQNIFDAPEDSYYVTDSGCSLKDAAEVVLLSNADTLLKAYDRRFEAAATGLLEKARKQGGLAALRDVARAYPLTSSGRTAMMELAAAACDSGDAASALRIAERLRRRPDDLKAFEPRLTLIEIWALRELRSDDAVKTRLADLKALFPEALTLDGRRVTWFAKDTELDAWLSKLLPSRGAAEPASGMPAWQMVHGDRRRNGVSSDAPPFLDSAWKVSLADRYDDLRKYDEPWNDADIKLVNQSAEIVEDRFRKEGLHPLPVASPLITNGLAVFAGFGAVKAFHLATGELAWSSEPVDHTLGALLAGTDSSVQGTKPRLMQQFVGQRAYRDHVDAALSTDGKRIYHIGHSGLVGLQANTGALPVSNRGVSPLLPRNHNYLEAYDINGGRCLWSIGGPPRRLESAFNRPEDEVDFDGAFFAAAPISWEGQLLCVVEQSRQLRIVAIDAEKNPNKEPPLWSQALLNSDLDLVQQESVGRRFAGVSVAMDGSTLVAALGNGTVVGFDVADRRWLWLHTYADPPPVDYRRMLQMNRIGRAVNEEADLATALDVKEWSDPRTLITGRNVLVTPFDDGRLLCLDRDSGKLLWARLRDQAMYLAGVHENVVVLVGKSDIRGLNLADGQPLWSNPIPPASGRGVRMGSRYVLPLSTGEVLTIDVRTGAPLARSPLASGEPAGNMAAAGGMLVTQTASEFRAFRLASDVKRDIEQRLAADSNDPIALAMRGELKLHQGDIAGGEKDLRSIQDPPARVRHVLAWALVNGLERDFQSYYTPNLNLDDLPGDAGLRMQAWSAVSQGLQARGDLPGALLAAVRSGESLNPTADRLLDRAESLRVRENRLVRGRIEDLWALMSPEQRTQSIDRIRERLTQLSPAAPGSFRIIEMLTGAILPADLELSHLRRKTMHVALIEQRLLRLAESSDEVIAAGANLELLRIAVQDPRMTPAPSVIAALTGRLKDVPLDETRPAGDLAQELLNQPEYIKRRSSAKTLSGELVAAGLDDTSGITDLPNTLPESGSRSPILEGWSFMADHMQAHLYVADSRGAIRLNERINRGMSSGSGMISTSGRLILAETADGFRVFDAIANSSVLSTTLNPESFESFIGGGLGRPRIGNFRGTTSRLVAPLRPEHLAYVKGTQLLVVDPLTGREHWSRSIENTVDLTSDAEFIASQHAQRRVKVFRASDGRLVRETQLPEGGTLYPAYRRDIQRLISVQVGEAVEIGLFHPARATWTWKKQFPSDTKFAVLDGRYVVALGVNGQFAILSDDDGHEMVTAKLDTPVDLRGLRVFQDAGRIYVVVDRVSTVLEYVSVPRGMPSVDARVFALRRDTGEQLWARDFKSLTPDLSQPGSWPFFLLTAAGEPDQANTDRPPPQLAYIIDRATGKTLNAAEYSGTAGLQQRGWKVDPLTGAVSIKVGATGLHVSSRVEAPPPKVEPKPAEPRPEADAKPALETKPAESPPPPPLAKPGS
jgi:outer membrane protein assembly factor BamB